MRYIKSFIENIKKSSYLVKYKVINHRATLDNGVENRISSHESRIHEFIIQSESPESANQEFKNLWNSRVDGYHPAPDLDIISVEKCKRSDLSKSNSEIFTF